MNWRILGPVGVALAAVGVTVALLPSGNGGILDPVARAANTTTGAGTAEFGLNGHVTAAGQSVNLDGNGVIDMKNDRVRMSMSVPIPGLGSTKTDGLLDGKALYLRMPGVLSMLGKSWVKVDIAGLAKSAGVDAKQGNPNDLLRALQAVGSSQKLGSETVGGVSTTHYRATIDPKNALDKIPDAKSAGVLKQMLGTSGLGTIPLDVWVDGSGRVRRESIKFSAAGMSADLKVEFKNFGAPVDTTPPAADQVMDAGALLGS